MTTIVLNSPDDVTPEVMKTFLNNELDELIINFLVARRSSSSPVFDSEQKVINFDIVINSEYAEGLFYNLTKLTSVKRIRADKITNAAGMFYGCKHLEKISGLNFPKLENACSMFDLCESLSSVSDLNFPELIYADAMFKGCRNLSSLISLNFPKMHDADDLFEGCCNLHSISHLNFQNLPSVCGIFNSCRNICYVQDLNFGSADGRYHVFCNQDSMNEPGIPKFRDSYLKHEKNSYPSWYFRSALNGSKFNFTVFLDEFFKFVFSYRSLGLELFCKYYLNQTSQHGTDILLEMLNTKNFTADLNHLIYPQSVCFPDYGTDFLRHAYHDVFLATFHEAESNCRSCTSVFKPFFSALYESFNKKEYRYRYNPLDGFTVELSDEKKYYKYGTYKRSDALKTGRDLLQKYSGDTELSVIIQQILNALEKIGESVPEAEDPADSVRDSIRHLDEIISRNHKEELEITGMEFRKDIETGAYERWPENTGEDHTAGESADASEPPVCTIEESLLDNLPERLPSDISEWIHNVRNIEVCCLRSGSFEPGEYPLKIVMYTEAIKEIAENNGINWLYLYEAVLANQFFRALLFAMGLFDRFEDPLKFADSCRKIPVCIPLRNTVRELWLQLQKDTLNHWYCCDTAPSLSSPASSSAHPFLSSRPSSFSAPGSGSGFTALSSCTCTSAATSTFTFTFNSASGCNSSVTGISAEVLDPLALAFEISWVKDRIITSGGNREWKKILNYELSRFGGLASYPSDPSTGAKYLITAGADRKKLAGMETINLNLSAVMHLSGRSMKCAYDFMQNTLAW